MTYIFPTHNLKRYRFPTHTNHLVMDRSAATASEVFIVELAPGEATPAHQHDDTEQIFYVLEGRGYVEIDQVDVYPMSPGDVVRIPPASLHAIHAFDDEPLCYLAVDCFPGCRPDAEPTWDDHVRAVCEQQGWDYNTVVEQ
ncbi:MAG: cupin domain-containing protein [Anaerolineae bacterium]